MVELREEEGEDEGDGGKITTRIRKVIDFVFCRRSGELGVGMFLRRDAVSCWIGFGEGRRGSGEYSSCCCPTEKLAATQNLR